MQLFDVRYCVLVSQLIFMHLALTNMVNSKHVEGPIYCAKLAEYPLNPIIDFKTLFSIL